MLIYAVHTAVIHDQLSSRLLTDFRYSGYIVGAVAHKRFHIDKSPGSYPVFFQHICGMVILYYSLALSGLGDPDTGLIRGDLQEVPVSG